MFRVLAELLRYIEAIVCLQTSPGWCPSNRVIHTNFVKVEMVFVRCPVWVPLLD